MLLFASHDSCLPTLPHVTTYSSRSFFRAFVFVFHCRVFVIACTLWTPNAHPEAFPSARQSLCNAFTNPNHSGHVIPYPKSHMRRLMAHALCFLPPQAQSVLCLAELTLSHTAGKIALPCQDDPLVLCVVNVTSVTPHFHPYLLQKTPLVERGNFTMCDFYPHLCPSLYLDSYPWLHSPLRLLWYIILSRFHVQFITRRFSSSFRDLLVKVKGLCYHTTCPYSASVRHTNLSLPHWNKKSLSRV